MQHSTQRYGITIPFDGVTLAQHRELYSQIAELGYTDLWSSEVDGADAFTPLAMAAAVEPRLSLGTAIASSFTRGPALLAQTAAAMAEAAPGRFVLGLGASSPVIVERWNGLDFHDPFVRTRDVLRFLREALPGVFDLDGYAALAANAARCEALPVFQTISQLYRLTPPSA